MKPLQVGCRQTSNCNHNKQDEKDMTNHETYEKSQIVQEDPPINKIEVQVERFPVVRPKLSKEDWDSGEGGGED
jgi:hypothetical protein